MTKTLLAKTLKK